ncbi:MAG TPA: hypothetical protein VIH64_07820 [Streptosporangiaceae bacterium]
MVAEVAEEEVAEVAEEEVAEVAEEEGGWRWCRPPWPPPPCRPFRNEPDRLVLLPLLPAPLLLGLSEAVGVLDGVGEPVLGVLAGARLVVGVGSAAGSWEAPADEAEPFPDGGGVGPWHGLAALRCVLSLALFLTGALVPGTGVSDAVGPDGVGAGVAESVGVAAGVLVAGDTAGFTVALPDLVPDGLTDGITLAGGVQVALGFELADTLAPLPWPGAPLPPPPPLIRWPVPAPLPPPDPFTGVVLPVLDEPMFVIACRTPGTAAAVPAKMHTAARATTGRSHTMAGRDPCRSSPDRPEANRSSRSTASAASAARYRRCRP